MIRRRGQPTREDSSSSDEEDAFSALTRKRGAKRSKVEQTDDDRLGTISAATSGTNGDIVQPNVAPGPALPVPLTSSMKRHHKPSDTRKAKMDALLEELAAEQKDRPPETSSRHARFVPEKKGSYVDPGEENVTTNMFVGNLAPTVTEEDLANLFLQFGALYSVKIIWPRTPAERSRNRNTGFVCFMTREDAEEAMDACNETDPFQVGRLLMMRWGKNVKESERYATRDDLKSSQMAVESPMLNKNNLETHVSDPNEIRLPSSSQPSGDGLARIDHYNSNSRSIDISNPENNKANVIQSDAAESTRSNDRRGVHRRYPILEEEYMTGRQLERARGGRRKGERKGMSEGRAVMTGREVQEFDFLVKKKLTLSRDAICSAMAFCFEKSASAREIANLLKVSLVDEAPLVSVDAKIARLYLLSDILFNSQQPGVRNAFMYRDAIEKMAMDVFSSLGKKDARDGSIGRMTMHKLRMAVKSVLGAWTEWSVYNPSFLDELEARFDGREVIAEVSKKDDEVSEVNDEIGQKEAKPVEIIIKTPQGDWTEVVESDTNGNGKVNDFQSFETVQNESNQLANNSMSVNLEHDFGKNEDQQGLTTDRATAAGEENLDGKSMRENTSDPKASDEAPFEDEADGEDIDGQSIADDDLDGAPFEEEDIDGAPVDKHPSPEYFDVGNESLNRDNMDGEDLDGEEMDECSMDGEDIDGEEVDRRDLP